MANRTRGGCRSRAATAFSSCPRRWQPRPTRASSRRRTPSSSPPTCRRSSRTSSSAVRALDRVAPWLCVPSVPDIFRPFGAYLIYGVCMSGPEGPALLRTLCTHTHNMAHNNPACGVVTADLSPDLSPDDPAAAIPSWRRFSCDEDVWCIKNLSDINVTTSSDWPASAPPCSVPFVDPREL
ncbi:putative N-acetyltransferase HLS1-like [Hordeum vulgare]|nr:putative N-acetyltransferase HLS1-like [Hordeum vulgare]